MIKYQRATAGKGPKAWALPRFWVSNCKKQPVKKFWGRILGLAWLEFAVHFRDFFYQGQRFGNLSILEIKKICYWTTHIKQGILKNRFYLILSYKGTAEKCQFFTLGAIAVATALNSCLLARAWNSYLFVWAQNNPCHNFPVSFQRRYAIQLQWYWTLIIASCNSAWKPMWCGKMYHS